ncbi:MAG: PEP-CTERM sorting domain-containing protein [Burkholderiaceae bacterium]
MASLARNFIPPDTMGAVGTTQYMEFVNGAVAVYDKTTHARTQLISDTAFWAAAGQVGANGDSRVLFDPVNKRWIAFSFGASVADIQIAVSSGVNALGPWRSTKFTAFAGGTADFPTLGMNANGIYIGTNNFNAAGLFQGVSLFTIPKSDLYGATPMTTNITRFDQIGTRTTDPDRRGQTFQGVVNNSAVLGDEVILSTDRFTAPSLFDKFSVHNPGAPGATLTATQVINIPGYFPNNKGHQPDGTVVLDTGDNRIAFNAYQVGSKIYVTHTEGTATNHTAVHWFVLDATSGAILDQGLIGDATHDYFEGSIAANTLGQVVIGYNRVGAGADGNASFLANAFITGVDGLLVDTSDVLLKAGLVGDYHCYLHFTTPNGCRERWGDYAAVTIDPTDQSFWAIGEFTREYNDAAGGHPGGTGGSRWGTWIAQLSFEANGRVPEPETITLFGLGLVGLAALRRRKR